MTVLSIFFLVMAICHFLDAKLGRRDDLEDNIRKKYRRYISISYFYLAIATFGIFVVNRLYHFNISYIKMVIIYAIPILYTVPINKRFLPK